MTDDEAWKFLVIDGVANRAMCEREEEVLGMDFAIEMRGTVVTCQWWGNIVV